MAYDYAGSWSNVSDHQANLYTGSMSGISTKDSLSWYIKQGASPSKINMGAQCEISVLGTNQPRSRRHAHLWTSV